MHIHLQNWSCPLLYSRQYLRGQLNSESGRLNIWIRSWECCLCRYNNVGRGVGLGVGLGFGGDCEASVEDPKVVIVVGEYVGNGAGVVDVVTTELGSNGRSNVVVSLAPNSPP